MELAGGRLGGTRPGKSIRSSPWSFLLATSMIFRRGSGSAISLPTVTARATTTGCVTVPVARRA